MSFGVVDRTWELVEVGSQVSLGILAGLAKYNLPWVELPVGIP